MGEMSKEMLFETRKAKKSTTWLMFMFLGWSLWVT